MLAKTRESQEENKAQRDDRKEVKVLKNHLNADTLEKLTRVFIEAKWFTNDVIAQGPFNADYKANKVQVKVVDSFEDREINIISSQMRQGIIERLQCTTWAGQRAVALCL
ncbi:MAG: hypothetical protein ACP5LF_05665 [Nitrososphaeria archaeon]